MTSLQKKGQFSPNNKKKISIHARKNRQQHICRLEKKHKYKKFSMFLFVQKNNENLYNKMLTIEEKFLRQRLN